MTVRVLAFAKLNLSLLVLGTRPDGFHEIDSLVQTIDLSDRVSVSLGGRDIRVENDSVTGPDLAERAARALLDRKGIRQGVRIGICKRIPIGAGLGGGSSDAAAVLRALDELTGPALPQAELHLLAAGIGSDVSLFLYGGLLRMQGRGERITRLRNRVAETFVLLTPPLHCDTGTVYAQWVPSARSRLRSDEEAARGWNDLLPAALAAVPALRRYHDAMRSVGAKYWGLSGSGAAFFAAFGRVEEAGAAAEALSEAAPEAQVLVCRPTDVGSCAEDGL